jgi:hypothetical protein
MKGYSLFPLRIIVLLCLAGILQTFGYAQPSALSLFEAEEIPYAVLETDMRLLIKNKFREEYQPATLKIVQAHGDTTAYAVEIRSRGNMRKEVCYYPPFFIKFEKGAYSHHKLKCVNICRDTDANEIYLLKEFIAYKIYHRLTRKGLDAHLIRVTYTDTEDVSKSMTRYAFVLQDEDEMAERFSGRVIEAQSINPDFFDPEQLALFSFFQYMIGNTDWDFGNAHNVKVFTDPETNTLIPVPYDFDYSGFVNTTYAVPHETVPVEHVTDRYNKCYCISEEMCEKTRLAILQQKEAIIADIESLNCLKRKSQKDCISYLEPFFKMLEDSKQTWRVFVRDCRND